MTMTVRGRARVAVLGAGLIGLDLIDKIQRSEVLDCRLVVGRDRQGVGLRRAAERGCATAAGGIVGLLESGTQVDVVFDASTAERHAEHWSQVQATGATLIDLTPTGQGTMIVPTVNGEDAAAHRHISLVSCGGQAAIPVLHAIASHVPVEYIEVVATAASATAGRAARLNVDHYVETTQSAIRAFTNAEQVKVMVTLSPAQPAPPFRVAMTVLIRGARSDAIGAAVASAAQGVRGFAAGFAVASCAVAEDQIRVSVQVTAEGGRIPRYAGNLDIINAAAVLLAEQHPAARGDAGGARGPRCD